MAAYYNEINPEAAHMLRQLILDGHIAPGDVDERSITEVNPHDLKGYTQCHFFAGIGGWSVALRLAGWPDDRAVWTGSAPCQPFSCAGKRKAMGDERHLFPAWLELIKEQNPSIIFGEQVASAVADGWLDQVYQGLEEKGYAVGAAVLPACSIGAPHRRDRLYFVAANSLCQRGEGFWQKPIQGKPAFSWCENVRRVEDLRGRSDLPEPLLRRLNDGVYKGGPILHALGNAIVPQVAAEFIAASGFLL